MISIVDYGVGNLTSIRNIFRRIGTKILIASEPSALETAEKFILPGVGNFAACMSNLTKSGLLPTLEDQVLGKGKSILGICVGMQLMGKHSSEGDRSGLGWFPGTAEKLPEEIGGHRLHVPHVGWNVVKSTRGPLFQGIEEGSRFYFSHSYVMHSNEPTVISALTEYGKTFISAIQHGNIVGTQFHPEKSHQTGVRLLQNFDEHF